jgi:hypothetical protein
MKTLIDRTCSRYTGIRNRKFYFIVTAADSDKRAVARTLEGFRGFTSCRTGAKEKGIIYGTGAWNMGDVKEKSAMKTAHELGNRIYEQKLSSPDSVSKWACINPAQRVRIARFKMAY